jgi:hypothetical protein
MEKDRKKIKEPFEPKDTPKPPQIIEPNSRKKRETPIEDEKRNAGKPGKQSSEKDAKPHLLSDDADIQDETTI